MIPPNILRRQLKRGPRLSKELRGEYGLCLIGAPARRLRPETLAKLKSEIERLGRSANPGVLRFVASMRERYEVLR